MPRRELKHPSQVEAWLVSWGERLRAPGELILIGSGALLWHAAQKGIVLPLPTNSMDVDPITAHEEVAELGYEAHIGSPFEKENGWHVNLMPADALSNLPGDWRLRAATKNYDLLRVARRTARPRACGVGPARRPVLGSAMAVRYDLEDLARLHYSRLLWRAPRTRARLLHVWEHPDHPHRDRFAENRALVVGLLECEEPQHYVDTLPGGEWSLRTLTREIPCIIWEFWDESATPAASEK